MSGRKHSSGPHFKQLFNYVRETVAWKVLTPVERCAYLEVKFRYIGDNNGRIPLSAREVAEALNVSKATGARALRRLVEVGLLVVETPASRGTNGRLAAEYRLTEYPNDIPGLSRRPSREFTNWRPKIQNSVSPRSKPGPVVRRKDDFGASESSLRLTTGTQTAISR